MKTSRRLSQDENNETGKVSVVKSFAKIEARELFENLLRQVMAQSIYNQLRSPKILLRRCLY